MVRQLVGVLLVLAVVLPAREASAKGMKCKQKLDLGVGYVEAFATILSMPPLTVNGSDTPRRLVGVATPGGTDTLAGFGVGLQFRCDWLVDDIVAFRYAAAFTGGASGTAFADDGAVNVSRGETHVMDFAFGFFGVPTGFQLIVGDANEWKVGAHVDWGMEHVSATGSVSGAGIGPTSGSIDAWTAFVRLQAAGCRRLGHDVSDASAWACLTLSPVIYDFGSAFPGVSAGLRVDL